ncbi:MAG: hypothetical protein A3G33_01760 [Omnitrophica bacterium RIFCSPLOWO2_12_FULL_44_17]|uniref:3D domain-containing protein n=1 Tax=Candidatus Danuiimicrobium aquiferis TaxID=1801832 RepID=A0A1G1KVC8_9BACT|nr:MAG: hypothetical protein A3B72_00990 [Omnitrophica bacterium RIFCSPHIGHO2_02_FULL_45_28]OGW92174.1 MAG: hypothetical protein A3E74_08645 [Omnitrophica bacterium RIFCSPHIGHO2_12_FULL_44_12]OGW96840.1 MAG: hypothetical protein A3G33_01760 [Omnitrophica bacterium RIFCSPLOWO2_12_FULL_44_17]OGX03841.1 MAG: hypothetical protein A3J12_09660 [Omnitrophica bacterium RIFCSPLOWO2_02_FULL_44_11]
MQMIRIRFKSKLAAFAVFCFLVYGLYYYLWGRYTFLVTAYCNCPICINVPEFYDGKFASGKKIYWGGIAADKKYKFGTQMELVPFFPQDSLAIFSILRGRRNFIVEDCGGKIRNRHIDLFIPDKFGGHQEAKEWGARWMRVKVNGKWAE